MNNLLWSEGLELIAFLVLTCGVGIFWWRPLMYVSVGLFLGCLYFFRNPDRVCIPALRDSQVLICPADGVVVDVQRAMRGEYAQKVAIFLSVRDVHVTWMPVGGVIETVTYTPGTFFVASTPESSCANERNEITVKDSAGRRIEVRQIAGKVARRVRCWVCPGEPVIAGQKFGMIKFGSRVEVLLPATVEIAVSVGQKVYGGNTVLGYWRS